MSGAPQFDITAIAVDRYPLLDAEYQRLDGVVADAEAIIDLLGQLGGARAEHPAPGSWSEPAVKARLRAWTERGTPSSLLLWLGHGESNGDQVCLACSDSVAPIVVNGFNPLSMADQLTVDWGHRQLHDSAWTLVIVEACGSGHYVRRVAALVQDDVRQLYLIGVSGDAAGYVGQLRQAFARALGRLTANDENVVLNDLIHELLAALPDARTAERDWRRVRLSRARPVDATVCAPLDVYPELMDLLAVVPADQRNHFFPKVRATERVDTGLHFVGRVTETATIRHWLSTAHNGMLVVTGRPGSGKSALLGNVLIRSSPRWRPVLEKQGWSGEPWAPDGGEVFDAALNLSGLFTREVVQRLTEALGVAPAGSEAGWSGADIEHLVEKLAGRRFTVMVDGLDEAVDPGVVAGSVLRRLAAQPHGRIVVGTRLSGDDQIDGPPAGRAEILEALGSSLLIPVTRDAGALAAYVRRRLAQVPPVGAAALTAAEVEQVAALVSGRDDEVGFLYARLVTHEVLADPDLARSGRLPDLLAGDHQAIFRHALDRLDRTTPRALALLKALAFTAGPGLPRSEHTWASVATAFSGGQPVTEADIDLLLERAAPYVTVDAGYGVSVYRLAHQIYRAVLGTDTR